MFGRTIDACAAGPMMRLRWDNDACAGRMMCLRGTIDACAAGAMMRLRWDNGACAGTNDVSALAPMMRVHWDE
jgi:hypothetical protein